MLDNIPWLHGGIFLVCLILAGVAGAGHTAFSHLSAALLRRLVQRGASRSQAIAAVARDPGGLLSGVSFLLVLAVGAAGGVAVDFAWRFLLPPAAVAALLIAVFWLILIVHDVGRGLAILQAERVGEALLGPIRFVARLSTVFSATGRLAGAVLLRRWAGQQAAEGSSVTEEDLRTAVQVVEETEELEQEERQMISSIFEMSDRDVQEIMVPRVDIVAIDGSKGPSDGLDLALKAGHSRLVVFEGDLDHVTGVVHLRDLAAALRTPGPSEPLAVLARPVHVVPEGKKIDELLRDFQSLHAQMALVVDEYGGTAGLVTIEDLLEEIVGEIRDEYDTEEDAIQMLSETEAIMDGGVSIHDANEALPLQLDQTQYETIGGLVFDRLGKVPSAGDLVDLPTCRVRVLATVGRRVRRVRVTLTGEPDGSGPET